MEGEYGPEVKDIEGAIYKTVFIGTQLWMAENLKVSTYNDGSIISNFQDLKDNDSAGAWGYYYNDSTFNAKYGKLYNWYALNPLANGNKNVCPSGYHVPTDAEWLVLLNYLGGAKVAGGKMKEKGTINWYKPNIDATNSSLFNALPGGFRNTYATVGMGGCTAWWSTTEESVKLGIYSFKHGSQVVLDCNLGSAIRSTTSKKYGFSVRCLKD